MKDRVPGVPGQFRATVAGSQLQKLQRGEPFTITLKRDDQPIVEGTPYSKAAVLPDALAVRLCPEIEDPNPADAFTALADQGVVSQGTKDGWFYRQWANGMAECWTTIENPAPDNKTGFFTFPFLFKSEPITMATFNMQGVNLPISTVPLYKSYGAKKYTDPETNSITEFFDREEYGVWGITPGDVSNAIPDNMKMNLYVVGQWQDIVNGGGSYSVWEGGLY